MLCAIQTSWDSLQCAARGLPCLLDKIVEIFSFFPSNTLYHHIFLPYQFTVSLEPCRVAMELMCSGVNECSICSALLTFVFVP